MRKKESTPLLRSAPSNRRRARPGAVQQYQDASDVTETDIFDTSSINDGKNRTRYASLSRSLRSLSFRVIRPWNDRTYYEDTYNDESWKCQYGTNESSGIWLVHSDRIGCIMAGLVWCMFGYAGVTMVILAQHHHCAITTASVHLTLVALALAAHVKTTLTDPGAVPASALPVMASQNTTTTMHSMCSLCQTYKPPKTHHCRICNRCISKMDHHCPWMNNCIGAANLKHFILFLIYTWTGCVLALLLFASNYFFCDSVDCQFAGLEIQMVRFMTCLCLAAVLFTSSMLTTVMYGVMTGVGTIDRLKKKANNTWQNATDEAVPLQDIFGSGPRWMWLLPTDPVFEDYDRVVGYATRQRLLRAEALYVNEEALRFDNGPFEV